MQKNIDRISHFALNKMLVRYGFLSKYKYNYTFEVKCRKPAVGFNLTAGWVIFCFIFQLISKVKSALLKLTGNIRTVENPRSGKYRLVLWGFRLHYFFQHLRQRRSSLRYNFFRVIRIFGCICFSYIDYPIHVVDAVKALQVPLCGM